MRVLNRIPTKWVEIHQAVNQWMGRYTKTCRSSVMGMGFVQPFVAGLGLLLYNRGGGYKMAERTWARIKL